ncbi:MAG: RNase adapter RapZ [Desulfohalobiaceae bacterium]|nr:RNase adapter RapZ [Desulfohalobiaceae bacterium]
MAATSVSQFPLVILTGLSGSGKSTALNVFEDLGFFCVDGLPAGMVTRLVGLITSENPIDFRGLALGMDIRQHDFIQQWQETLDWLSAKGIRPRIIFLEARMDVLMRRYAETRRPHPLETQDLNLEKALEKERELLSSLLEDAERVVDTSDFSIHDLRRYLQEQWSYFNQPAHGLRVHIVSFGFKYGIPPEADLVFDLRFLPNPYFVEGLKELSGLDPRVAAYVLETEAGVNFLDKFLDFLLYVLPLYVKEGRYRMTLAFGCTGGKHRSVAVARQIHTVLKDNHYFSSLEHKHLELG